MAFLGLRRSDILLFLVALLAAIAVFHAVESREQHLSPQEKQHAASAAHLAKKSAEEAERAAAPITSGDVEHEGLIHRIKGVFMKVSFLM